MSLIALIALASAAPEPPLQTDYLRSRLVSASSVAVPGERLRLGVLLDHDPHWHTYWVNPGDSGLPTRLEFSLPHGVELRSVSWPAPERFDLGGLVNYGYSGRLLLPVELEVSEQYAGDSLPIDLDARWLICHEECLPGRGQYRLSLPVAPVATADPRWAEDFVAAQGLLPQSGGEFPAAMALQSSGLHLQLPRSALPADASRWSVFPEQANLVDHLQQPTFQATQSGWTLRWPLNTYFQQMPDRAAWVLRNGDRAVRIVTFTDSDIGVP